MSNYKEKIKETLQSMYDKGVADGKRLGMSALYCRMLELQHTQPNVDVIPYVEDMIDELTMTPEQYEADAKVIKGENDE